MADYIDYDQHGKPSQVYRQFSQNLTARFCRWYGLNGAPLEDYKDYSKHGDSSHAETAWVTNLTRLYLEFRRHEHPLNFSFIDLGSGKGIATLFAAKYFKFCSFSGVEIDKRLNDCALENLVKMSPFLKRNHLPTFLELDVANLSLSISNYFLFLFNPFGWHTMQSFLSNNLAKLENKDLYFALVNDLMLEHFMDFSYFELVYRNKKTNVSLVRLTHS